MSHVYSLRKDELIEVAARVDRKNAEEESRKQRDADQARFDTESAQTRQQLADAQKAAQEATQKAKELEQRAAPRKLTDTEKAKLAEFLSVVPRANLVIKAGTTAGDERAYADEIAAIFRSLSWNVRVDNAIHMGPNVSGLWLVMRGGGGESVPVAVRQLHYAIGATGLIIREDIIGDIGVPTTDEIWLCIGAKN